VSPQHSDAWRDFLNVYDLAGLRTLELQHRHGALHPVRSSKDRVGILRKPLASVLEQLFWVLPGR
jgi:hypothetical protein